MSALRRAPVAAMVLASFVLGGTLPAAGQRPQPSGPSRPGWRPRVVRLSDGLTAAQRAAALAKLDEIERILLRAPALARPQGFEIRPVITGGARRLWPDAEGRPGRVPGDVIEYHLQLGFVLPTSSHAGGGSCLRVTVNGIDDLGGMAMTDAQGRSLYAEMPRGDPLPGATQVYERLSPTELSMLYVVFTAGGAPPWRMVTREEYYRARILETEGKDGAIVTEVREAGRKTPYQQWVDGAAERRQMREEGLRIAAQSQTPAEVARLRAQLEATERDVTERLKASEAEDRARNEQTLTGIGSLVDRMYAELERMTPTERQMPALIDNTLSTGPIATGNRMADRDAPPAWRVLAPDRDFWRARRSPVEARSIVVHMNTLKECHREVTQRAVWETYQQLDWAAFAALLEPR